MFNFFKTSLPKISIRHAKLLDPIFIFYCKTNPDLKARGWNDWTPPSREEIKHRIDQYKNAWNPLEKKVLEGLFQFLGIHFKRNIIDVYIVSGNPRQMSDPIIIKSGYLPNEFVHALIHELIHRLLSENNSRFPHEKIVHLFPKETSTTQNHILTFSILKYLYLEVLGDKKLLDDAINVSKQHHTIEYARAWEIIEEKGYRELISQLRS